MSQFDVQCVVECLRELADIHYQQRVWLASSGPEISSFTEAVCQLFDDSGLGSQLDKERPIFSAGADAILRKLLFTLSRIDDRRSPSEIIEDPLMREVRELSQKLLALIT